MFVIDYNLNYKSSYGNQMKTLINSIELISMNYMGSSNNTMHKFGIEYGYIALAMGNMLKSTNNNIKNITINKTESIIIDYTLNCILDIIGDALIILVMVFGIAAFEGFTAGIGTPVVAGLLFLGGLSGGIAGLAIGTYETAQSCFGGF